MDILVYLTLLTAFTERSGQMSHGESTILAICDVLSRSLDSQQGVISRLMSQHFSDTSYLLLLSFVVLPYPPEGGHGSLRLLAPLRIS